MLNQPLSKVLKTTSAHIKQLKEMGILTVEDLLLYFPRGYEDESDFRNISELTEGEVNIVRGLVGSLSNRRLGNGMMLTQCLLTDDTGSVEVIWFNQAYIMQSLKNGDEVILSGRVKSSKYGRVSFQSPKFEKVKEVQVQTGRVVPKYYQSDIKDSKYKITSKWLREKIQPLLYLADFFKEFLPEEVLDRHDLISFSEAVKQIHYPDSDEALKKAKERLGFDELFALQFKALKKKRDWQMSWITEERDRMIFDDALLEKFLLSLPFKLTNAQTKTLNEALIDLRKPYPMLRLVQGDVGSGKTVVAAIAALMTVMSRKDLKSFERPQVAVMAPTGILAKQHYKTFQKLLKPFDIRVELLTGAFTDKQKRSIVENMKLGLTDVVIGTHALIQEGVDFKNLGLAVIDEQHRFGVKQREYLSKFGNPHLLYLSATPIPRTLALTIYGDQDISVIDEMPPGRQEIITRIVPESKRVDAYRWIEDQVAKGRQVYVICPLIDESDTLQVKAVTEEFRRLKEEVFQNLRLGLLHGKLAQAEKDHIMYDFSEGNIDILVSTSVIEVGIDVPNATIILIEGSERFGLSQLHQFRGRVGRGEHQSYCFLFTNTETGENVKRLKAMVDYSSGFKLSEIDLELRGPGEVYGVKQSGIPDLKMASLSDSVLIMKAREEAEKMVKNDSALEKYPLLKEKLQKYGHDDEGYFV